MQTEMQTENLSEEMVWFRNKFQLFCKSGAQFFAVWQAAVGFRVEALQKEHHGIKQRKIQYRYYYHPFHFA